MPGISSLSSEARLELRFEQIAAGIHKLVPRFVRAGLEPTTVQSARTAKTLESRRRAIVELHDQLLSGLTAADFRLGKAYGLGRALADTCYLGDEKDTAKLDTRFKDELKPERLRNLYSWLLDLKTVLPDHAGEAVYQSLRRWCKWAQARKVGDDDLDWNKHRQLIRRVLTRRGKFGGPCSRGRRRQPMFLPLVTMLMQGSAS